MDFLRLGLRNLRRNPRRTIFTAASLSLSLFIFSALQSVVASLDANIEEVGKLPIAVVMHRSGFSHRVPLSYRDRIRKIRGVKSVVAMLWYGGSYGDPRAPEDNFMSMGGDSVDALRTMWGTNLKVSDSDWAAFMGDRTAALVGPQLKERYGWERGQKVTLNGTVWPTDLTFTVAGTAAFRTDQAMFLFHRDYLDQALGGAGLVTLYWVELESVESLPEIARLIDRELESAPEPTKTISQQQLTTWYLGMIGDIRGIVRVTSTLVILAILFVTANSIALSTRERHAEIGVLKALGFQKRHVVTLLLIEALLLSVGGGALGCLAALLLFRNHAFSLGVGPLSGFKVDYAIVATGFLISTLVGTGAAILPAWRAARLDPVAALRKVS